MAVGETEGELADSVENLFPFEVFPLHWEWSLKRQSFPKRSRKLKNKPFLIPQIFQFFDLKLHGKQLFFFRSLIQLFLINQFIHSLIIINFPHTTIKT